MTTEQLGAPSTEDPTNGRRPPRSSRAIWLIVAGLVTVTGVAILAIEWNVLA